MSKPHYKLTLEDWQDDTRKRSGNIHRDYFSKGRVNGKQVDFNCFRAEITIHGQTYHHREKFHDACIDWLNAVLEKRILPTDSKADWLRSEQRKDMQARHDEMIAINCEEGILSYNYQATGDMVPLKSYIEDTLLPHLVYYSCHSLNLGLKSSMIYSREAVACLLTKLAAHRPVMNMTALCKRIIRSKSNGNTYYYDHMPKDMRMVISGIDYAPLEKIWKVTKDRRI